MTQAFDHLCDLASMAKGLTIHLAFAAHHAPIVRVDTPRDSSAHQVLQAQALSSQAQHHPFVQWASTNAYLTSLVEDDTGPVLSANPIFAQQQAQWMGDKLPHTVLSLQMGKTAPANIGLHTILPSRLASLERPEIGRTTATTRFKPHPKHPEMVPRFLAILDSMQGPFYATTTTNTTNAKVAFKAPGDMASIILLDRLMRAPVALLKGEEREAPKPLQSITRLDPRAQSTTFPAFFSTMLAP